MTSLIPLAAVCSAEEPMNLPTPHYERKPGDPDWHPRYEQFNRPGDYHNGGVWPFAAGLYVAALVASGQQALAERIGCSREAVSREMAGS